MRALRVVALAALAAMRLDAVDGCYDVYWIEHLRVLMRFTRRAEAKNGRGVLSYLRDKLRCPLDVQEDGSMTLQEEEPEMLKKVIDDCACSVLRSRLLDFVRLKFRGALDALPATASVDAFYLRHARAQIRFWRRALALEGDRPLVAYYDGLIDRCFTQPHAAAIENHLSNVEHPSTTPSGGNKSAVSLPLPPPPPPTANTNPATPLATTSVLSTTEPPPSTTTPATPPATTTVTPLTTEPPPATTTTVSPTVAPASSTPMATSPWGTTVSTSFFNNPLGSALLAVLGGVVGALVVVFYCSVFSLIQDPRDGDEVSAPLDRSGYVAIASPRGRARVHSHASVSEEEEEDEADDDDDLYRPLLRTEDRHARIQRSVDATE